MIPVLGGSLEVGRSQRSLLTPSGPWGQYDEPSHHSSQEAEGQTPWPGRCQYENNSEPLSEEAENTLKEDGLQVHPHQEDEGQEAGIRQPVLIIGGLISGNSLCFLTRAL